MKLGHLFPPPHIPWVLPEQFDLLVCVSRVPHGVPHHLTGARLGLDQLELDPRLSHRPERGGLPVRLGVLLPHHGVKLVVVLQTKSRQIIIRVGIWGYRESHEFKYILWRPYS